VQQLAARHEITLFAQESNHPVPGVAYHKVFCLSRKPRWINQLLFAIAPGGIRAPASMWCTRTKTPGTARFRPSMSGLALQPAAWPTWRASGLALAEGGLEPAPHTYVWLEGARFGKMPARHVGGDL